MSDSRAVIYSYIGYSIYLVEKETPQRLYGKVVRDEDRWWNPTWIPKERVIADITGSTEEQVVIAAQMLIDKLTEIKERFDERESELRRQENAETAKVLEGYEPCTSSE